MARLDKILILLQFFLSVCNAGNILFWMSVECKSRFLRIKPLISALAHRNHTVTVVSRYTDKEMTMVPNINSIVIDVPDVSESFDHEALFDGFSSPIGMDFKSFETILVNSTTVAHQHPGVQKLLRDKVQFDAIIITTSGIEMGMFIAKRILNSPVILYSNLRRLSYVDMLMGNTHNPAYIPFEMFPLGTRMTFFERVFNTIVHHMTLLYSKWTLHPMYGQLLQELFNLEAPVDTFNLVFEADFAFFNNHPVFEGAQPSNPNCIDIGGLQLREPKPLEGKLKEWIEDAPNGVILLAFGTVSQSSKMSTKKKEILYSVFKRLKRYRFIWKMEDAGSITVPDNVLAAKWIPQQDILGHPNVKLFITHAGWSSSEEAVYHGVPMVTMPLYADQHPNSARLVRMGCAVEQNWPTLTEENLVSKIEKVISDPSFKRNVTYYSEVLKDNEVSSLDKAIYYTEYVMRHKGAKFLATPSNELSWFQERSLDVIVFITLIIFGAMTFFFQYCCCCCRKLKYKSD